MGIIDFDDKTASGLITDKLTEENALSILTWLEGKKKKGKKGYFYEVDGNPVVDKDTAVSLKATFVHNKWCTKDAKLSELAYDGNKDLYEFCAYPELIERAGLAEADTEEDDSVDV